MINKYTNKQRGLLAVIMAMVMVFAGAAFVAAEVDATGATKLDEDTHVVSLKQNETTTYYADFETAWNYAVSQNADFTIDLLKDTNSDGVKTTPGFKGNIILNLNDHTLTFGPDGAGSEGTETSAFQLRAEAKSVTINGGIEGKGIITSGGEENSKILRMIQTYTGLTLNDVTIDGSKMLPGMYGDNPADYVTVSVGNGSLAITGSTSIIAHEPVAPRAAYALAFGTNDLSSYDSTSVTIETTGTIEGITFDAGKTSTNSLTVNAIGTNSGITINENTSSGHDFNIFIKKGVAINVFVPENMIANGYISFGDKVDSEKKDTARFENVVAGSDGITISEGSVRISGTIDASSDVKITATGEVYLDGVEITADTVSSGSLKVIATGNGNNVIIDGLTVGKDATLAVETSNVTMEGANVIDGIITGSFTIAENSTMILNGNAYGATVTNKGTISVGDSNATLPGTIIGDGKIDASAVQENVDIGGIIKSNATFGIEQIVTIVSDTEIIGSKSGDTENNTILTINGSLIIPEGVTLTIGEYSALIVDGYNAKLINNGTIVVESQGIVLTNAILDADADLASNHPVAFAINKASAENNGTIILDYTEGVATQGFNGSYAMHIQKTVFQNNGTILVEEENTLGICRNDTNEDSKDVTALNNNAGSEIISYGAIIGYINNKSTIAIDGYALGFISMQSTDAALNIVELRALSWKVNTYGIDDADKVTLTIDDEGLKHGKVTFDDKVNVVKVKVDTSDKYAIQGLVVKPVVKTFDVSKNGKIEDNEYFNLFDISGSLVNETEEEVAIGITVTLDGRTIVSSELSVSEGVTIAGASTNDKMMYIIGNVMLSKDSAFTASYVTVYGKMISEITTLGDDNFIASKYEIKADLVNKTPAQVIYTTLAQAIADGATKIECLGDVKIDTEVTIPAGTTVEANNVIIKETGFLTLADGAKFKVITGKTITVDGVFSVENKKNLTASNVVSDVVTSDDKSVLYSGLAYALSVATDGQTVEISKNVGSTSEVTLKSDATIKTGVILDTNNKDIKVDNDVTLTIDGVLFLDNSKISVAEKNNEGTKGAGEIVLNGTIKSVKAMDYNIGSSPLSAAYYVKIENSMAYNYVEPVSVAAPKILEADEAEMEIKSFVNDMKIGNVSFAGTTEKAVTVTVIGNVSGNITVDEGTVAIQSGKFVGTVTDGVGTIGLDGTTSNAADKALKVASVTDDDEKAFTISGEFAPSEKKKVTLSGEVVIAKFKATPVTVDGNVKVINASNIDVLTVNGTVTIPNEVTLTVEDAYVFGSITVSEPTDKPAGKLVATDLYVGLEKKNVYVKPTTTGASASVTGNTSVSNHLFVLAGTTIPEDLVKEDTLYQELYVEGELWMTIYALGTETSVTVNQIPVDDVKFEGWASEEGKDGKDNFTVKIENKKVYADIEYDVYVVSVQASEGIDDVYIDGILMLSTGQNNVYTANVAAGTHTISYTLANGYTGEAKMLVDGKEVSGYTFTAEGDFGTMGDVDYQIILQGIEKAPAEVGGGDAPVADKDAGMDLTDILLIVLVVLIVIMAIIVALRMMRS